MKYGTIDIAGKTVLAAVAMADGAGYSSVRIEFTDRTQIVIEEKSQSGDLEWYLRTLGQRSVDTKHES